MQIVKPSVELIWITPDPEKAIEFGARVCYKSEDKYDPSRTPAFLNKIIHQYHHESVVEHAAACFHIVCDRGVSHEFVRHRLASFSQESTRYCNYGKKDAGIAVIQPPEIYQCWAAATSNGGGESVVEGVCVCDNCCKYRVWEGAMQDAERGYLHLLKMGLSPQMARSVLPTCLKTEMRVTANFREWMHIIKLRTAKSAHPQIREIVLEIQRILQESAPAIFAAQSSS